MTLPHPAENPKHTDGDPDIASGPFAEAAAEMTNAGLAVMPVRDKKPTISGWNKWSCRPIGASLARLIAQHGTANVGVITGPSGLTVVDIDSPDPTVVEKMLERFGPTPLRIRTPRGGTHLYYLASGETNRNLRPDLAVDIKASGGFVVAPPSVRADGVAYTFLAGSWDDLHRLPKLRPGSLPRRITARPKPTANAPIAQELTTEGCRNATLFSALLHHAPTCDSREALRRVTGEIKINSTFSPPLDDEEVGQIVANVWRYQESGRNWVGKGARVFITAAEMAALEREKHGTDGLHLLMRFRLAHWNRDDFAASPEAMARDEVIPGWGERRYLNALRALVNSRILCVLRKGGRGPRSPTIYGFTNLATFLHRSN